MATGDDALAAGMEVVDGNSTLANTIDDEINLTRDYIAQRTSTVTPITKGGTGADSAATARVNLGIPEFAPANSAQAGKVPTYSAGAQLATAQPTLAGHAASKAYVDAADAQLAARPVGVPATGGTFSGTVTFNGNVFLPNAFAATSGYTVAYINGDGRLSRGASSERYKTNITPIDPESLGNIWPDLTSYQMKEGDGGTKFGYIAERLNESDDLRPFVVYQTASEYNADTDETTTRLVTDENGELVPDSIDFIALLIAQNAQLHKRLTALEAK